MIKQEKETLTDEKVKEIFSNGENYPMNIFKKLIRYNQKLDDILKMVTSIYALNKCDVNHSSTDGKTIVSIVYDHFSSIYEKGKYLADVILFLRRMSLLGYDKEFPGHKAIFPRQNDSKEMGKVNYEIAGMFDLAQEQCSYKNRIFLAKGSFGTISTGRCGKKLAVIKTMINKNGAENSQKDLYKEYLVSKNIPKNCGVETYRISKNGEELEFVTEYAPFVLENYIDFMEHYQFEFIKDTFYELFKSATEKVALFNQSGRLHLDIKPGNLGVVKVGNKFEIRLIDFGLVLFTGMNIVEKLSYRGTPPISPPEWYKLNFGEVFRSPRHNGINFSTDYYSVVISFLSLVMNNMWIHFLFRENSTYHYELSYDSGKIIVINLENLDAQSTANYYILKALENVTKYYPSFLDFLVRATCNLSTERLCATEALNHEFFGGNKPFQRIGSTSEILKYDCYDNTNKIRNLELFYNNYKDIELERTSSNISFIDNKHIDFQINTHILKSKVPNIGENENYGKAFDFAMGERGDFTEFTNVILEKMCEFNPKIIPMRFLIDAFLLLKNIEGHAYTSISKFDERIIPALSNYFSMKGKVMTIDNLFNSVFSKYGVKLPRDVKIKEENFEDEINNEITYKILLENYVPDEDEFQNAPLKYQHIWNKDLNLKLPLDSIEISDGYFSIDGSTVKVDLPKILAREYLIVNQIKQIDENITFKKTRFVESTNGPYLELDNVLFTWRNFFEIYSDNIDALMKSLENVLFSVKKLNQLGYIHLNLTPDTIFFNLEKKVVLGGLQHAVFAGVKKHIENHHSTNYSPFEQTKDKTDIFHNDSVIFHFDDDKEVTYSSDCYSVVLSFLKLLLKMEEHEKILSIKDDFFIINHNQVEKMSETNIEKIKATGMEELIRQSLVFDSTTRITCEEYLEGPEPIMPYSIPEFASLNSASFEYEERDIIRRSNNLKAMKRLNAKYRDAIIGNDEIMEILSSNNQSIIDVERCIFLSNLVISKRDKKIIEVIQDSEEGLLKISEIEEKIKN